MRKLRRVANKRRASDSAKTKSKTVTFHNKLNPQFRQIHVDGGLGGVTPRGEINLNFFAERLVIPKSSEYQLGGDGKLIKVSDSKDSKNGVIREYEFGVYMDLSTAKQIFEWLEDKIQKLESITKNI